MYEMSQKKILFSSAKDYTSIFEIIMYEKYVKAITVMNNQDDLVLEIRIEIKSLA